MKRKNIISLTIAFAFFTLAISGLLLYFKQKAHIVEIGHTIFGLLFVGFAIFHVINNWQSLKTTQKTAQVVNSKKNYLWQVSFLAFC